MQLEKIFHIYSKKGIILRFPPWQATGTEKGKIENLRFSSKNSAHGIKKRVLRYPQQ